MGALTIESHCQSHALHLQTKLCAESSETSDPISSSFSICEWHKQPLHLLSKHFTSQQNALPKVLCRQSCWCSCCGSALDQLQRSNPLSIGPLHMRSGLLKCCWSLPPHWLMHSQKPCCIRSRPCPEMQPHCNCIRQPCKETCTPCTHGPPLNLLTLSSPIHCLETTLAPSLAMCMIMPVEVMEFDEGSQCIQQMWCTGAHDNQTAVKLEQHLAHLSHRDRLHKWQRQTGSFQKDEQMRFSSVFPLCQNSGVGPILVKSFLALDENCHRVTILLSLGLGQTQTGLGSGAKNMH